MVDPSSYNSLCVLGSQKQDLLDHDLSQKRLGRRYLLHYFLPQRLEVYLDGLLLDDHEHVGYAYYGCHADHYHRGLAP